MRREKSIEKRKSTARWEPKPYFLGDRALSQSAIYRFFRHRHEEPDHVCTAEDPDTPEDGIPQRLVVDTEKRIRSVPPENIIAEDGAQSVQLRRQQRDMGDLRDLCRDPRQEKEG